MIDPNTKLQHCLTNFEYRSNIESSLKKNSDGHLTPVYPWRQYANQRRIFLPVINARVKAYLLIMAALLGTCKGGRSTGDSEIPATPPPNYSHLFFGGLLPFYRGVSAMSTISNRASSAQNPSKIPVFNLYHTRRAIAQGIDGALAMRFKRRFPVSIVKFAGFGGEA